MLGLDRLSAPIGSAPDILRPWLSLFLLLGAFWGASGAGTAYSILYRKYRQDVADENKAVLLALRGALTTFLLFLVLWAAVGYVIAKLVLALRGN
jgi:hypothetical protein